MGPGDTVLWRARHFGLNLQHESRISAYSYPYHFQEIMLRGMFRSFVHDHYFETAEAGTLMRDVLTFAALLAYLGTLAERLVLRRYLTTFLQTRNEHLRRIAESDEGVWAPFLSAM